ncbi:MAG: Fic family protein [Bacteroidota bacterium]
MTPLEKSLQLKQELDSLRPLSQDDEARTMQKFRLEWNYHSNHLEGNALTYEEANALILFGITAQGKPLRDHYEIRGHDEAVKWMLALSQENTPLTEEIVLELHARILKEPYEVDAITPDGRLGRRQVRIGAYKLSPNYVHSQSGEVVRFASPEETPEKMQELLQWYADQLAQNEVNPIFLSSLFHANFLRIHPFDDGNGRMARLLTNYILLQFGYPPVIIKTEDKARYFSVLRQADYGLMDPLTDYLSRNLNQSLAVMIRGARGEKIDSSEDLDRQIAILEEKLRTVGQEVGIIKGRKVLSNLFKESLAPLVERFMEVNASFEKFYLSSGAEIQLVLENGKMKGAKGKIKPSHVRKRIHKQTHSLTLSHQYATLKQFGREAFSFTSTIQFIFAKSRYSVLIPGELKYDKLYDEYLSSREIERIIKAIVNKHKEIIERRIEEAKREEN